jgi:D-xylose 1-dehydrogenase (NADP+, D-xylono-1,5-lactone-forming)
MKRVGWGIMGCGWIATEAVAPAIRWSHNGRLVAIASRDREQAESKAHALGAERSYAPYESMLSDAEVDAVYIGLPNGMHEDWAMRCAEAGKHVLCEKSLTMTARSAKRMVAAFTERGLRLIEAFMYRHHPQWAVVQRLLDDGAIGAPRVVRASFCSRFDNPADHRWSRTLGGGALWDLTCYAVNGVRYVTGVEPLDVAAFADAETNDGVDASTQASLRLPSGLLATVTGSLLVGCDQSLSIDGERGTIEVPRPFVPGWQATTVLLRRSFSDTARPFEVGGANQHLHQVEHFASLVLDPALPSWPAEDGCRNVAVCEAIERSWRTRARVEVDSLSAE